MSMIPPPPPSDPTAIPDLGPRFYYPGKEPPDIFEVTGEGFVPGEDVQVAIIRQEVEARMDGRARALVNANELGYARRVILMGAISGTTILSPVLE